MSIQEYIEITGCINYDKQILDLVLRGIDDLTGIEKFKKLEKLNLYGNHVENIGAVFELKELKLLDIRLNPINSIKGIRNLKKLKYLFLNVKNMNGMSELLHLPKLDIIYDDMVGSDIEIASLKRTLKYKCNIIFMINL